MESFVARIWLEKGPRNKAKWRGHIQHVQGDQETYFQDLSQMGQFLEDVSGVPWDALKPEKKDSVGAPGVPDRDPDSDLENSAK